MSKGKKKKRDKFVSQMESQAILQNTAVYYFSKTLRETGTQKVPFYLRGKRKKSSHIIK